jgi:hypothetical protein
VPTEDIEVMAEVEVDGENHILKKVQTTDGNGKNTNRFMVDEWDYKEKDYKAEVEKLMGCRLDLFKALSSPTGFTALHWTAQRALIMPMAKAVKDTDIADSDLLKLLKEHDIEDIVKKYDKDAKALKKKLMEIPIRIDENERMKPEHMDLRISTLKDEQKAIAQQIANAERILFLCEEYRKAKCQAVQDSINEKFPSFIKFELFDSLGKENCEVTNNGVRFSTLSTGQRIKVGAHIIQALQKFYGVQLPVWYDNFEAISGEFTVIVPQEIKMIVADYGLEVDRE